MLNLSLIRVVFIKIKYNIIVNAEKHNFNETIQENYVLCYWKKFLRGSDELDNKSVKDKKQVPLRLSPTLWNEINQWAEEDFRSINGQIEFLLTEAVKQRKKKGKADKE